MPQFTQNTLLLFALLLLLAATFAPLASHAHSGSDEPATHDEAPRKPRMPKCKCNAFVSNPLLPSPINFPNPIWRVARLAIAYLPIMSGIPHRLAIITAAMFDARGFLTGGDRLTAAKPSKLFGNLGVDERAAYAGLAAMRMALMDSPNGMALFDDDVKEAGLGRADVRMAFGTPFVQALMMKYPINMMPPEYTPPNMPSADADADCRKVKDVNGWQPLCVRLIGMPFDTCVTQTPPFRPLVNASLISSDGKPVDGMPSVNRIINDIRPAPHTDESLKKTLKGDSVFARQFNRVLLKTTRLNDEKKAIAELLAVNAVVRVLQIMVDELVARGENGAKSTRVLFAVAASMRDGFVGTSTLKLKYNSVRSITVLQCGLAGKRITAWRGPHRGVGSFVSGAQKKWRPYIQTPNFPSYPSGHSAVAAAGMTMLNHFYEDVGGANCLLMREGASLIEGRIDEGQRGYIKGITDVPNKGMGSTGYVPAKNTTVCWRGWGEYIELVSKSRVFGGVHTVGEVVQGELIGKRAAKKMMGYLNRIAQ